ncbi:MAG: flagellar FlbD family protein [Candidatus Firestonebacteria bacterium]|nr:flagellar FlbD family protein [Candidatus Firestonebacteria bacterium]
MVELTKLNGDKMVINEAWIELMDAVPDTTITLNSGNKVVVLEKMEIVMEKILRWQAGLRGASQPRPKAVRRKTR